jgi:hypothetical protein
MPARIRLVNWRWLRWSGGEWGKGDPEIVERTVEAILDSVGGKWRVPDAPELEEYGQGPLLPVYGRKSLVSPRAVSLEADLNETLRGLEQYRHPYNPRTRIEVVELFEEPEWNPDPGPLYDDDGLPVRY